MRRYVSLAATLALLAALVSPALAQTFIIPGPGGIIQASLTSVTISNSAAAAPLWTNQVPAGFATQPLHLSLLGILTTSASSGGVGTINVGCNYGSVTAASIALVNGLLLDPMHNASSIPIKLDFFIRPYLLINTVQEVWGTVASATNTAGTNTSAGLMGQAANVATTADLTGQPTLACIWQWASAATTNSVTILNGTLTIGY